MAPRIKSKNSLPLRRADKASQKIISMIVDGKLAPGTRIASERELAEQLGVSRTTLRDSLNHLEARGYIESRPKSGTFVCTSLPDSMRGPIEEMAGKNIGLLGEINDVRKALEIWAVEKAVASPLRADVNDLKRCVEKMQKNAKLEDAKAFEIFRAADLEFHRVIARMTKNSAYMHLLDFLANLIIQSIAISRELLPENYGPANVQAHRAVYEAIKARDKAGSRKAMAAHFEFVEKFVSHKGTTRKTVKV